MSSWSNSTNKRAWSWTSVKRLLSRMRSKTFGRLSLSRYGNAFPGCRLVKYLGEFLTQRESSVCQQTTNNSARHSISSFESDVGDWERSNCDCTATIRAPTSYTPFGQDLIVLRRAFVMLVRIVRAIVIYERVLHDHALDSEQEPSRRRGGSTSESQ